MEPEFDELCRRLVTGSGDAIVYADCDGVIQYWNAAAGRLFGFDSAEAVGRSLDIIIPDRLRARHWEGFRRTMATGNSRYQSGALLSVPALKTARRSPSSSPSSPSPRKAAGLWG